ncbi:acyl-CoA dehydrogenase family protein [Actinokineospora enzanensis]|uniref:acyl-CoA dehydrogenase family protein n=1 Tax=Actinokineospora enzanensis TaxID=155975 RepID=UPI0003629BD9|nr:acyl-CoA dehydrogenase family protein [Actinokineospora enzanensis]
MTRELQARTAAGARMVKLAEEHAADFAGRADMHDREGTFVRENFDAMRESGFLGATAPEETGGMGVDTVRDLVVAVDRLARGCPSTAIAANMHLGFGLSMARTWRHTGGSDNRQLTMLLRLLGRGRIVMSHAGTEPGGGALSFPSTEARPVDGGYLVNGHKIFATNSEIADLVVVFTRVPRPEGGYAAGTAMVRRDTPGMTVEHTWDALGMRGSGSHDVRFADCLVPAEMMVVGRPFGDLATEWGGLLAVNFPLVAAYVGIAEKALELTVAAAGKKRHQPFGTLLADRSPVQLAVADMRVRLAAARSTLASAAEAIDEFLTRPDGEHEMAEVHAAVQDFQLAKLVVNQAACAIVDTAMSVTGGQAYRTGHILGRLYRDVRAGGFMQPYSPLEAMEYIGRVTLGLDPWAELQAVLRAV